MRFIHILTGTADPRSVDGVNKVVHWLATTQVESGTPSAIWSVRSHSLEVGHEHKYPIETFRQTKSRFLLDEKLREAIDKLPQDTWVQLHSVFVPELTAIARLLKKRGIPYGFTAHGGYLSRYFDRSRSLRVKKAILATFWENWMLRNAAMLHVIGASERADLERRAPGQKMFLIPNGYSTDQINEWRGHRQEDRPAAIMFCGRHVIKQKGLDLLIEGFALYRMRGGTLRMVLIGDGPDHDFLVALAERLGVNEHIEWPGILSREKLTETLRGAAAFVHTSRFDVLPTSCLEAAGLSLPLFVSEETNFGDYIIPRNAGWLCRPNTPAAICDSLFAIERTPAEERLSMGENARRMIEEELNWSAICKQLHSAAQASLGRSQ
jgi:glycosyltransferase involved in cell wall biosynthesis